jgi:hypothetical protein
MKKLLVFGMILSLIFPLLIFLLCHYNMIYQYNNGIHWPDRIEDYLIPWHFGGFIFLLGCLGLIPCIILFFLFKFQFKKAVVLILIFSLSLGGSKLIIDQYQPGYQYFMEGYEINMKKNIPFAEIKTWLSSAPKEELYNKSNWPVVLQKIFTGDYKIDKTKDNKNYMWLEGGGPFGHYGLVVGADANSVPKVYRLPEYRKDIEDDVFIWHELQ